MDPLAGLPGPADRRIAVHVTDDALRHIRRGHPWLWEGSITRVSHDGSPGDLAVVFDAKRKFVAIGLFDPNGPIRVRLLHHGAPAQIDREFFTGRLIDALDRRRVLADDPDTTAWRMVHGENDGLAGLVVDRYADHLVMRIDTAAWLPHLAEIRELLVELVEPRAIVLRTSRRIAGHLPPGLGDGTAVFGDLPDAPVEFLERGLVMTADLVQGQKTGHFLDQRDNRQLVATRAFDADVLDVFCNSGGFSTACAAGGARSVHSIDVSAHAIAATEQHVEMNRARLDFAGEHTTEVTDAFAALEELADRRARFDVVIIDPPSFAPNASSVPAARRSYRRLTALATELVGDGGTLFQASCSSRIDDIEFHDLVADEVDRAGFIMANTVRTTHAVDHPITFDEGSYLKAVLTDLRRRR